MRYIIMCGGDYPKFETPRQMLKFRGEELVNRTIRLLHENQITDIAISATDERFEKYHVPVLKHDNDYTAWEYNVSEGYWCDGFYLTDYPVCYLFGDVVYSPAAIKTIVETETDDVMFFGSAPPFPPQYVKPWIEPFGFKVQNTEHFRQAIADVKRLEDEGRFTRRHIAWEVWNVVSRGTEGDVNVIHYNSYVHINDYTNDIDKPEEIPLLEIMAGRAGE